MIWAPTNLKMQYSDILGCIAHIYHHKYQLKYWLSMCTAPKDEIASAVWLSCQVVMHGGASFPTNPCQVTINNIPAFQPLKTRAVCRLLSENAGIIKRGGITTSSRLDVRASPTEAAEGMETTSTRELTARSSARLFMLLPQKSRNSGLVKRLLYAKNLCKL